MIPVTFSERLAENLVAGHLLMTLVRAPIVRSGFIRLVILLTCWYFLIILETR